MNASLTLPRTAARRRSWWRQNYGFIYIVPWLIGFLVLQLFPFIASFIISFTKWDFGANPSYTGLDNYTRLFNDPLVAKALVNTVYYTVLSVPGGLVLAFLLAVLLNRQVKGIAFYRTAFYLPSVTAGVATSVIWIWLLQPNGLVNGGSTGDTSAQMFDPDKKHSMLGDAGGPDGFQWLIDLIHKYKFAPAPGEIASLANGSITDPFAAGRIGMRPGVGYSAGSIAHDVGDRFKWGLMPIPKNPTTGKIAYDLNSDTEVIPLVTKQRNNYEMAIKLAVSYYDDAPQKAIADFGGTAPLSKKWLNSPEYLKPPPDNKDLILKLIQDPKAIVGWHQQTDKAIGPWLVAVRAQIDKAFTGDVPAKDALAAAMKAGDQALATVYK